MKNITVLKILKLSSYLALILSTISCGMYVNFLTRTMIETGKTLWLSILEQGSLNLLLVIAILPAFGYLVNSNIYKIRIENYVNDIFRLTALSLNFYKEKNNINIHYYERKIIKGKDWLKKQRKFYYYSENMVDFKAFDGCDVDTPGMVICKAFRENRVVFEILPDNHNDFYPKEITHLVDKELKWVLAAPVWKNNNFNKPEGIMALFGASEIVNKNEDDKISDFKKIGLKLSRVLSTIIFDNNLNTDDVV